MTTKTTLEIDTYDDNLSAILWVAVDRKMIGIINCFDVILFDVILFLFHRKKLLWHQPVFARSKACACHNAILAYTIDCHSLNKPLNISLRKHAHAISQL